jgi:predicted tellurium resistance membrane protein TerC
MSAYFTSDNMVSFIILVILEIVLGIDNVIFVSIILNRLQKHKDQQKARRLWMINGIILRSLMLAGLSWLLSQKGKSIISIGEKGFDLASLVMLGGGLFLMYKAVMEIHHKLEGEDPAEIKKEKNHLSLSKAVLQILIIDAVFSFDSIITAGGTAKHLVIMVAAVVIAMITMFLFSANISDFIHKHPTLKMLALSFLVMIGLGLIIEGWDATAAHELKLKNYIYFGMAFSFIVEMLNMVMRKRLDRKKNRVVELNEPTLND